jgi:ribonuclease P protein component
LQSLLWTAAGVRVPASPFTLGAGRFAAPAESMIEKRAERIGREHRLRSSLEIEAVKRGATAVRGQFCILLLFDRPDQPSKVGFIASRKSVGGAVQRNRARRRMREIVRRRWQAIVPGGRWMIFIATRGILRAPHLDLAADIERLVERAGVIDTGGDRT